MEAESNEERTVAPAPPGGLLAHPWQVICYVVILVLLFLGLVLPPVSLRERILYADYAYLGERQWTVETTDTARLQVMPEDLVEPFRVEFLAVERNAFQAGRAGGEFIPLAEALPSHLIARSPLYHICIAGASPTAALVTLPIPPDSENVSNLDLYGWTGSSWAWLPRQDQLAGGRLVARLSPLPRAFLLAETQAIPPLVGATLRQGQQLPPGAAEVLTVVSPRGLLVNSEGALEGMPVPTAEGGVLVLPCVSNWDPTTELAADINAVLADPAAREAHAQAILQWMQGRAYAGITMDYRNVLPSLATEVNSLVHQLADGLHAQGKRLAVRVSRPVPMTDGTWDTGAYDWATLHPLIDSLDIPAPLGVEAYRAGGEADRLLEWTACQVERTKVQVVLSADSLDMQGTRWSFVPYAHALGRLAELEVGKPAILEPGVSVPVQLAAWQAAQGLQQDQETSAYWFGYVDEQGQQHTVWLENSSSLAHKLRLITKHHLGGVTVEDLASRDNDPQIWQVLRAFAQQIPLQGSNQFSIWWTVRGPTGDQVSREAALVTDPLYIWKAPEVPGQYLIAAEIAADGQTIHGAEEQVMWVATPIPTPTPTSTPTPTPTPTPELPTPTPAPTPTASPTPLPTPALPDGVVMSDIGARLNVRVGPGTVFERVGQLEEGDEIDVIGCTEKGDWLQILYEGEKRWVSAAYVELNLSPEDIPVIPEAELPKRTTAKSEGGGGGGEQEQVEAAAPARAAVAVAPSGTRFGYGVQAHFLEQDHGQVINAIKGMGFNWVKQQVRWQFHEPSRGQYDFGELDRMVDACNANGVHVLFSVCAAPPWATSGGNHYPADYKDFWNFMGALAQHFKGRVKAYEVWNEQNLQREWGAPLSASDYVRLLAEAYRTIKAHDPNAIVVSGAPTPTGAPPPWAVDDFTYLEQMYQAGLKSYCDAVGVHPSGYNVPAHVTWDNACATITQDNASFRGPCDSPHHSWCFRSTMEGYRNIMVKYGDGNKKLWPTEFGWATVENLGVGAAAQYEYANDNTEAEQAANLKRAYEMGRNWGWVGVMFLWNLNYGPVCGAADEKAAFGVLRPDWSPRPAYAALRDMPK